MAVFSVASKESLHSCSKWVSGVKSMQNTGVSLITALVANKCEFRDGSIDSRAEVAQREGKEYADSLGMAYFETSAVSFNANVL